MNVTKTMFLSVCSTKLTIFFQTYADQLDRVTSIAITLPGLVNSEQGVVLQMPHYNVENLALGPEIYKATGLPVFIANDTRAWALAEKLFGHSQENDNSVLISIHHGLGAGIILDGRVLQGRHGNIGELGHIQIDPNGKRCHCGNIGCLETVASSQAIREEVVRRISEGEGSILADQEEMSIESICEAAANGDPLAVDVIEKLGRYLGSAIAIVINLFNPEKILIGGVINQAKRCFIQPFAVVLKNKVCLFITKILSWWNLAFITSDDAGRCADKTSSV